MAGALTVDSGFVSLNEANTIGSVALVGGVLAFGNGCALGAGTVALSGGELLATANETLTNALQLSGTSTIAAAHGTTLNENAPSYNISGSSTLNFGALGEDGTILWHTNTGSITAPDPTINIQAGTLEGADSLFNFLLDATTQVSVAAGATLDVAGNSASINLQGAGTVTNSGAAATLTLFGVNFSGVIAGPQSLVASGAVVLSGADTYTGTTTINSTDSLKLGVGGATGSIGGGAISDGGTLYIDRNNALTLTNAISGAGVLQQIGIGVTSINTANNYSGGTTLSAGTLAIGNGGALGSGTISLSGGELLATATETLTDVLQFSGTSTIAAAHGTTLDENAAFYRITGSSTLNFGALGQDGTILWHTGDGSSTSPNQIIDVLAGTLKGADASFAFLLGVATQVTVAAGATVDWAGNAAAAIDNLQGAGTVTNSGAAQTMSLAGTTNFSGTISGALSLDFDGNAALSGLEDCTGGATLEEEVTVANSGTYVMVANNDIDGSPVSMFVNNGLFEKTGGGVSHVTSNLANNGFLDVQSGSMQFSGGFTNNGVIHGLVTQNGGVTTITKAPQYLAMGGGETIVFADSSGDTANLYDTGGGYDTVEGSNGTIGLNSVVAVVLGGGDKITLDGSPTDFADLYGTGTNYDTIVGSNGTIDLNSAVAAVMGGGDKIGFDGSSTDFANLYFTGAAYDTVVGSNGTVDLNSAVAVVMGGGDKIGLDGASTDFANLYYTGANYDSVVGSNGTIDLNSAVATVAGGGDKIGLDGASTDFANLYYTGSSYDTVVGSNGTVDLNSAVAVVQGGGDKIGLDGSSTDYANLYYTGSNYDTVVGSNGTIGLNDAVAVVQGGGDKITLDGSSTDFANLYNTGGTSDTVQGSNGTIGLNGAGASVTGNGDTLNFYGGTNSAELSGTAEAFVFVPKFGADTLSGFSATDSFHFSSSDFPNFAAVQSNMVQSGIDTVITLDPTDKLTLTGVNMNSLTSSQFHFS